MPESENTLFLARQSYRRRRVRDGSRLLPLLGTFLFFVPLLWEHGSAEGGADLAQETVYLFIVWFLLVAVAAILARWYEPGDLNAPMGRTARDPSTETD